MKEADQKRAATAFVKRWQDRGNERQDSQTFWLDLTNSSMKKMYNFYLHIVKFKF